MKRANIFGLVLGLPMLLWQLLFFAAPLVFLVVMSFWLVKNFRLAPDFSFDNWVKLLGAGYFWDIYLRTFTNGALAAAIEKGDGKWLCETFTRAKHTRAALNKKFDVQA